MYGMTFCISIFFFFHILVKQVVEFFLKTWRASYVHGASQNGDELQVGKSFWLGNYFLTTQNQKTKLTFLEFDCGKCPFFPCKTNSQDSKAFIRDLYLWRRCNCMYVGRGRCMRRGERWGEGGVLFRGWVVGALPKRDLLTGLCTVTSQ